MLLVVDDVREEAIEDSRFTLSGFAGGGQWRQELQEQAGRGGGGTLVVEDGMLGFVAELPSCGFIVEQMLQNRQKFFGRLELSAGVGFFEDLHNVAEVPRVRAEHHRSSVGRRFNHVLPASIAKAAADECNVRQTPAGSQFTDRIQKTDGI